MDRRSRKTRSQLMAGMLELMHSRPWETVSVQDLCDAADIARSTFYLHFSGKDALVDFAFQYLADDLRNSKKTRNLDKDGKFGFLPTFVQIMTAENHAFLYNNEESSLSRYFTAARLAYVLRDLFSEEISASTKYSDITPITIPFLANGVIGVISTMHTNRLARSNEDLIYEIDQLIERVLA